MYVIYQQFKSLFWNFKPVHLYFLLSNFSDAHNILNGFGITVMPKIKTKMKKLNEPFRFSCGIICAHSPNQIRTQKQLFFIRGCIYFNLNLTVHWMCTRLCFWYKIVWKTLKCSEYLYLLEIILLVQFSQKSSDSIFISFMFTLRL